MPRDCRARCPDCWGRGGDCVICDGHGRVCPICRGLRYLHRDVPVNHKEFGKVFRCESCTEGNNVSPVKEVAVIKTYLRSYVPAGEEAWAHQS